MFKLPGQKDSVQRFQRLSFGKAVISTRGAGLSRQAGVEYLAFVDADDWVDKELYSIVHNKFREKTIDFLKKSMYLEQVRI